MVRNDPDAILERYLIKNCLCSIASHIDDESTRNRKLQILAGLLESEI